MKTITFNEDQLKTLELALCSYRKDIRYMEESKRIKEEQFEEDVRLLIIKKD